jgi:DNA primase
MDCDEALELAGETLPRSRMIRCPLHEDKQPSLKVNDDWAFCFSCGWSGDGYGLYAILIDQPVEHVLKTRGKGGKIRKTIRSKVGRQAMRQRWQSQQRRIHNQLFERLHEVYGQEHTDVLVEEIERMSERWDDMLEQVDELPLREKEQKLNEFRNDELVWLDREETRLIGAGVPEWKGYPNA